MCGCLSAASRSGSGKRSPQTEEDKLNLEEAIKAATINNAWLMNKENEFGSITVGKSADFVVLEQNLFDVDEHEISKVKIEGTYYRGKQTYTAN